MRQKLLRQKITNMLYTWSKWIYLMTIFLFFCLLDHIVSLRKEEGLGDERTDGWSLGVID